MEHVLTLVVQPQNGKVLDIAEARLAELGFQPTHQAVLGQGTAMDLYYLGANALNPRNLSALFADLPLDWAIQPAAARSKKLFLADMDSTMVSTECIDELADFAGIKPQVAAITRAAMAGRLDFEASLTQRVALLEGLGEEVLEICYRDRVRPNPGAQTLIKTLRAHSVRTVLVSGGFQFFTKRVTELLGFDRHVSNDLEIIDGRLTGSLRGPICGPDTKGQVLAEEINQIGGRLEDAAAVGDGANDLTMLKAAGLGVSYHGKAALRSVANGVIKHTDLTAILFMMGFSSKDFAEEL